MHIAARTSHKGVPTAHCAYSRSGESLNFMKYNNKDTCLFFDQVNNYSKFRCFNPMTWLPSTDLPTVIVDKWARGLDIKKVLPLWYEWKEAGVKGYPFTPASGPLLPHRALRRHHLPDKIFGPILGAGRTAEPKSSGESRRGGAPFAGSSILPLLLSRFL